ncbi:MAG: aspartate kinase [Candidatus Pacearchaeota archaeon]
MAIVCKFGGTSLANAERINKAYEIVKDNPKRQYVVVSAPGKESKGDTKVTDLLISCAHGYIIEGTFTNALKKVEEKFLRITKELGLEIGEELCNELEKRIKSYNEGINKLEYLDLIKSFGERANAQIVCAYFNKKGLESYLALPEEIGLYVTSEFGKAYVLDESYENIKSKLSENKSENKGIAVIPGFYGITKDGKIATFARGGSDLTGSIIAASIDAEIYENFTDVDGIFAADPRIIENPKMISKLTYDEMRELSYMGTTALQEEAVIPVMKKGIPIHLRNTFAYPKEGTYIVGKKEGSGVVGIAMKEDFISINLRKWLLNREKGVYGKIANIALSEDISIEHIPSSVDSLSIIIHSSQLENDKLEKIVKKISDELKPDRIEVDDNLTLICVVGEGMKQTIGLASRATTALARAGINIKIINQGASEINMIYGVRKEDGKNAIEALYREFF